MDDLKMYIKVERSLESLVQTVWISSDDTWMEFDVEKPDGITQPDGGGMKRLSEGES